MANKSIKGLTIEIGGDTTKLGKALEGVEKQSRDLSSELGEINRLLKLDPGNTELLAQKQKVLADAIQNTGKKLDTLKEAEKQVQAQFEKGEASEEQVRALQREIIATEKKMDSYEKASKETADALKGVADSADKAGDASEGLGSKLGSLAKGGLKALAAGVTAAMGALVASAEASREYRAEMGKLDAAFTANGHSADTATNTYKTLQGVIGETDQSVEAAQQISLLAESEEDAARWAEQAAGVVGQFGDALQPEVFYESANETMKLGEATGAYVQMLEGTGMSVEEFNAGLAACNTEAEKQAYMLAITEQALGAAGDRYRETNAEIIRANQANEAWTASMAEVGATVEPILTDVKMLGASLLSDLVPGIKTVAEGFRGMLNGDEGAAADMGAALSGVFEQLLTNITDILPSVGEMAVSLVTTLTTSLLGMLPQLLDVGVEVVMSIVSGISSAIPKIVASLRDVIPKLVSSLQKGVPQLLQGVMDLLEALVSSLPTLLPILMDAVSSLVVMLTEQLGVILPQLLNLIVSLVNTIVGQLPVLIPQIVSLVVSVIQLLAEQLPLLIPQLVTALVAIVTILTEQLPVIIPMLIDACITIVAELIKALPGILVALTKALPQMLKAVWDAIVMVFVNLPEWFGQLFTGAWELIKTAWSAVGDWFAGIWQSICDSFAPAGEWFTNLFTGAWDGIKNAWSSVKSFFSGIWSGIKNAFGSVGSWFKDTFSKAWQAVKNVFSTGGKVFEGIKDGISDVFKTVVNAIIRGINKVIATPFNTINKVLSKIKNVSIANVKPFNSLISTISVPSIPELEEGGVLERGQVGLLEGKGAEAVVPLERNKMWINKVAREFLTQVKNVAGADILQTHTRSGAAAAFSDAAVLERLDGIMEALENGQILTIDGEKLVGATLSSLDAQLGRKRLLTARGAL